MSQGLTAPVSGAAQAAATRTARTSAGGSGPPGAEQRDARFLERSRSPRGPDRTCGRPAQEPPANPAVADSADLDTDRAANLSPPLAASRRAPRSRRPVASPRPSRADEAQPHRASRHAGGAARRRSTRPPRPTARILGPALLSPRLRARATPPSAATPLRPATSSPPPSTRHLSRPRHRMSTPRRRTSSASRARRRPRSPRMPGCKPARRRGHGCCPTAQATDAVQTSAQATDPQTPATATQTTDGDDARRRSRNDGVRPGRRTDRQARRRPPAAGASAQATDPERTSPTTTSRRRAAAAPTQGASQGDAAARTARAGPAPATAQPGSSSTLRRLTHGTARAGCGDPELRTRPRRHPASRAQRPTPQTAATAPTAATAAATGPARYGVGLSRPSRRSRRRSSSARARASRPGQDPARAREPRPDHDPPAEDRLTASTAKVVADHSAPPRRCSRVATICGARCRTRACTCCGWTSRRVVTSAAPPTAARRPRIPVRARDRPAKSATPLTSRRPRSCVPAHDHRACQRRTRERARLTGTDTRQGNDP